AGMAFAKISLSRRLDRERTKPKSGRDSCVPLGSPGERLRVVAADASVPRIGPASSSEAHRSQEMKHSLHVFFLAIAWASLCFGSWGCKGGRVRGSTNGAPHLDDRNAAGDYMPYYQTGEMHQPRYVHQALRLKDGHVFVSGGSDERGFSALDTAEIF